MRLLAAAAVLLLAIGGALFLAGRGETPPAAPVPTHVLVSSIPLRAGPVPDVPLWPRAIADHETTGKDGLAWIEDVDTAVEIAEAGGRPLFVFLHHDECPMCHHYASGPFRDETLGKAASDFVLLKVPVGRVPGWIARGMPRGWPMMGVFDPSGDALGGLTGMKTGKAIAAWLGRKAATFRESGRYAFPDWATLRAAARKLRGAEVAGDAGERLRLWREVEQANAGVLSEAARASRLGMEDVARTALRDARKADEPARVLAAAEKKLHGTPYAADLARVREHVERYGAFPELRAG